MGREGGREAWREVCSEGGVKGWRKGRRQAGREGGKEGGPGTSDDFLATWVSTSKCAYYEQANGRSAHHGAYRDVQLHRVNLNVLEIGVGVAPLDHLSWETDALPSKLLEGGAQSTRAANLDSPLVDRPVGAHGGESSEQAKVEHQLHLSRESDMLPLCDVWGGRRGKATRGGGGWDALFTRREVGRRGGLLHTTRSGWAGSH